MHGALTNALLSLHLCANRLLRIAKGILFGALDIWSKHIMAASTRRNHCIKPLKALFLMGPYLVDDGMMTCRGPELL